MKVEILRFLMQVISKNPLEYRTLLVNMYFALFVPVLSDIHVLLLPMHFYSTNLGMYPVLGVQ